MYANFQTNQILTIEAIRYLWLKGIEVDDKNDPNSDNIQIKSDKNKKYDQLLWLSKVSSVQ